MMYPQQIARRVQDLLAHDGEKTFEDRNSALAETSGPSNDVNEDATVSGRDENDDDGDDEKEEDGDDEKDEDGDDEKEEDGDDEKDEDGDDEKEEDEDGDDEKDEDGDDEKEEDEDGDDEKEEDDEFNPTSLPETEPEEADTAEAEGSEEADTAEAEGSEEADTAEAEEADAAEADAPEEETNTTEAALTALEEEVAKLRAESEALEAKDTIAKEDMVTLNIVLAGTGDELERACKKMNGRFDKALQQCQLDVTDCMANIVRKVIAAKPKDKAAEDHQVSFAKHAPTVFFATAAVQNAGPSNVVLRRVFRAPRHTRVPPWRRLMEGYRRAQQAQMSPYGYVSAPPPLPYGYESGYGDPRGVTMPVPYGYGYRRGPVRSRMAPRWDTYRGQPCGMQLLSQGDVRGYAAASEYAGACRCTGGCAQCGGAVRRRTRSSRAGTRATRATRTTKHRRTKPATKVQRGGSGAAPRTARYQHQTCPNHQRYVYDAQGHAGCMAPHVQGGQRFVFPIHVASTMAPTLYPATGSLAAF
jgi:hypothetical protein